MARPFRLYPGRREAVVQVLSRQLGGEWKAIRQGFGWYYVRPADGKVVRRYAESVLDYDGYSDTKFNTVLIDDQGNRVGYERLYLR